MIKIIIVCLLIMGGVSAPYIFKKNDGVAEQTAERALEKTLGLPDDSVDFSPDDN